ncbi:hypothetical protein LSTR_LSTR010843 [Laodelphax striatellus]|uniref:MAD2L1-binding protein n=1 Tax=Laodelphax striatellus TaxID=195883 RepID=A0A482WSE9_LAOST|nr:hypothetical protein LSTR_LSTR010843 [Laodelphax striatellus]
MNKTRVDLNIKLNDLVTFQSCSTLVSSIIKYLIYQRHQIPYTFEVLKHLVKRRKELVSNDSEEEQSEISRHDRLTVEREFNKALDVYEAIDSVLRQIDSELHSLSPEHNIQEIVIIFGTTALHPKNVFRIVVPPVNYNHSDSSHPPQKLLNCLFRSMMTSDELNSILDHQMCPTNTFILMKTDRKTIIKSDLFHLKDHFRIPPKAVGLKFVFTSDLRTEDKKCCCVEDMSFFFCSPKQYDSTTSSRLCHDFKLETVEPSEGDNDNDSENSNWFQFNFAIKGFKDCKLNGSSVTNLWMKYARKQVDGS